VQKESAEVLGFGEAAAPRGMRALIAWGRQDSRPRAIMRFAVLAALAWAVMDACYTKLPLIRPGADIVMAAKFDAMVKRRMFAPTDHYRVFVFGNSKTMAGFRPDEFDAAFPPGVRSYNLGLPGEARFLPILKAALAAGNVPTHVLLTIPWDGKPAPTWLDRLRDDEAILYTLVPFRDLPRDAVTFLAASRLHMRERYEDAAHERARMLEQRGWYFIKSQSLFEGDALPDDYSLPTDHPAEFLPREIPPASFARDELEALARKYGFRIVMVPGNMRGHAEAAAPAADDNRLRAIAGNAAIRIAGPDYWVYPAADFADPVHLNPRGATAYTHDLARLAAALGIFD
jgi:hypothetical protein